MEALKRADDFRGPKGPVVLVIMDGVGIGKYVEGDMVLAANTPVGILFMQSVREIMK